MSVPHSLDDGACVACRARKVRCIVENWAASAGCVQCQKDGQRCVFEAKRSTYDTRSRTRKAQEKRAKLAVSETSPTLESLESHERFSVRSSADALFFLSDAAARHGDAAKSPRNPTDSAGQHDTFCPPPSGSPSNINTSGMPRSVGNVDSQDPLESPVSPWDNQDIQNKVSAFRCRLFMESIVMPQEALAYVFFFFSKLYPFFPFVPDTYYTCVTSPDPDVREIRSLFEEDFILLGCLITVSSRYYHLPAHVIGGYERSCEVHNRCWHWTRCQVSKVLFEGSRPPSLLSLPKPIHAFIDNSNIRAHVQGGRPTPSYQFVSEVILQPAFRTDQVSWSYTSNRYLVTLFSCLIMSQSLARRLGRPALMDFDDVDLIQVSQAFYERNLRLLESGRSSMISPDLSLGVSDQFHNAFVDLMKLLARAQEVLHPPTGDGIVDPKAETPETSPRLLTLMQHFDILNQNWKTQYAGLFEASALGMSNFSKLTLRVDFEYLRLYEFSTTLGAYLKHGGENTMEALSSRSFIGPHDNDWEFPPTSLAYYIEQAIDAAEALLRLILSFQSPTTGKTLRYASSRHYMKIVFAAVFLIQALRTGIRSRPYQELLTATLNDTAITLEGCSVDAAHPAFRYSILLRGLMNDLRRLKPSDTSPIFSLTIGPRECRQPLPLVLNETSNSSGISLG
ncbi:hypothetical protein EDB81DRAFT_872469 [Dactylonectria macrodidyma]|uniref:Zn(2)-C6 fungal-type domain-containing protein n=1 Tax=Dactylonectria macrodidyma TaxID=307937 RepID=A0A9P9IM66_9HYPO|nr:hypothetical protein EDB81DRAFT_872469 [Dactylonectria macrodidyma]